VRWNGVSNPIESGHPCLGCSEPGFWDGGSFYAPATLPGAASAATETPVQRGAAVYDSNCASCHGASPASLNTPPDEVPPLLRSGKLRAHRFSLEDGDMQALFEYLKESGK
jgi:hydrogenase small subunit